MMTRRTGLYAGALLLCAGISQPASALSVDVVGSFDAGSLTNTNFIYARFENQDTQPPAPVPLPINTGVPSDSVAYFGWGIDKKDSFIQQQLIQSHFWFNGVGSTGGGAPASVTLGDAFSLGQFTYTNEQTVLSGGVVGIDFSMAIQVDALALTDVSYRIEIDNTWNGSPNPADTARLLSPQPLPILFNLSGTDYQIAFNGFSRDGGNTFETEATLAEGAQTSAEIYATITEVSAVPVPAAAWLFGSGLIGLVGVARRKRTA